MSNHPYTDEQVGLVTRVRNYGTTDQMLAALYTAGITLAFSEPPLPRFYTMEYKNHEHGVYRRDPNGDWLVAQFESDAGDDAQAYCDWRNSQEEPTISDIPEPPPLPFYVGYGTIEAWVYRRADDKWVSRFRGEDRDRAAETDCDRRIREDGAMCEVCEGYGTLPAGGDGIDSDEFMPCDDCGGSGHREVQL